MDKPPDPKSGASANSATPAKHFLMYRQLFTLMAMLITFFGFLHLRYLIILSFLFFFNSFRIHVYLFSFLILRTPYTSHWCEKNKKRPCGHRFLTPILYVLQIREYISQHYRLMLFSGFHCSPISCFSDRSLFSLQSLTDY